MSLSEKPSKLRCYLLTVILLGLPCLLLAENPRECNKRSEAYLRDHKVKSIRLDSNLAKAPKKLRPFLQQEVESARAFALNHELMFDEYVASVVSSPWGVSYPCYRSMIKPSEKERFQQILEREKKVRNALQSYLFSRKGVYTITLIEHGMCLAFEEYYLSKEEMVGIRTMEGADQASSIFPLEYGQVPHNTSMRNAFEIWINPFQFSLKIPIFFNGHYVADLWVCYCLGGSPPLRQRQ